MGRRKSHNAGNRQWRSAMMRNAGNHRVLTGKRTGKQ